VSCRFLLPAAAVALIALGPWIAFAQRVRAPVAPPPADRVLVPAGAFTMGADTGGEPDERPAHRVELRAFRIDRTELPREHYVRCVRAGVCSDIPAPARFSSARQPVIVVSWPMARRYCRWAGGRLPTEEEFEKAAGGTDRRVYPWGNEPPTLERAVYAQPMGTGATAPVGTHPAGASPYGALDMAGNVWEWTETTYDPYAYQRPTQTATCESALAAYADLRRRGLWAFTGAYGIPEACHRVLRGGAWNYRPQGLRVTNRVHHAPDFRGLVAGFRCAADVPEVPAGAP